MLRNLIIDGFEVIHEQNIKEAIKKGNSLLNTLGKCQRFMNVKKIFSPKITIDQHGTRFYDYFVIITWTEKVVIEE